MLVYRSKNNSVGTIGTLISVYLDGQNNILGTHVCGRVRASGVKTFEYFSLDVVIIHRDVIPRRLAPIVVTVYHRTIRLQYDRNLHVKRFTLFLSIIYYVISKKEE